MKQLPTAALAAALLSALSAPALAAAPGSATAAPGAGPTGASCVVTGFRVRGDFTAALDSDRGWAAPANTAAMVEADRPFRIRFGIEAGPAETGVRRFGLEYRRNGGEWTEVETGDFPYPSHQTPPVSTVSAAAFGNGAPTADLLRGSDAPFRAGAGVALADLTPGWRGSGAHGEWEWALVIRRLADGAVQHEPGDRFEFRMVDGKGCLDGAGNHPMVTLEVPDGHLGGTFVETPGPIGPWQASNGDLYFMMEPAETGNVLMMMKSVDGGRSWHEADAGNRPVTSDLEGFASVVHDGTIHMLHQTSDDVWHHAFRMSGESTSADSWTVRDERLASPVEPPTQVAALAARSDGSLVGIYGADAHLAYRIRSANGTWGGETLIDADAPTVVSGPMAVTGSDDTVHLAYTVGDGTAWYRRILPDGRLTARQQLAEGLAYGTDDAVGSILPLAWLPASDTLVVVYRLADGTLWSRRSGDGDVFSAPARVSARRVVQGAIDSDQAGADAVAIGDQVHVLFIEQSTGSVHHAAGGSDGRWSPDRLLVDDVDAQWIRGRPVRRADGSIAYGYVFDAGSNGGSGMNRYRELDVEPRPLPVGGAKN
ncbi:MAG: glycoside hydrolase [Gammaproteobacteria bacterium]|nr:glycoside hydrolase [Gammaproteobacteria bacterium]